MIDRFMRFLRSDHFPVALACILFITTGLDIGMTNYVYRKSPELFYKYEGGWLPRMFFVTDLWWISYLAYSFFNIFIVGLTALASEKRKLFGEYWISVRVGCLLYSFIPLLYVFLWGKIV
jgi:cytochrome b subunit of formate dehydrogenase